MTRSKKILLTVVVLLILTAVALYFWKTAKAPTNEQNQVPAQTPTPTPVPTPTPSPTPTPAATTGTLVGKADTATLHINKILVYNSTGGVQVSSTGLNADGTFSLTLAPGSYKIDYQASPDLYPHSPESFTIVAGQTHEVDFIVEN